MAKNQRSISLEDYRKLLRDFFAREGAHKPFPKRWKYRLLILFSATRGLEPGLPYSEAEINEALQAWHRKHRSAIDLDHVTLRRFLVDLGFLDRNPSGTVYAVIHSFLDDADWAPEILTADEEQLLQEIRESFPTRSNPSNENATDDEP